MKIFIIIYAVVAFILLLFTDFTVSKIRSCNLWSIWDIMFAVFWPIMIVFEIALSVIRWISLNDKGSSSEDPL